MSTHTHLRATGPLPRVVVRGFERARGARVEPPSRTLHMGHRAGGGSGPGGHGACAWRARPRRDRGFLRGCEPPVDALVPRDVRMALRTCRTRVGDGLNDETKRFMWATRALSGRRPAKDDGRLHAVDCISTLYVLSAGSLSFLCRISAMFSLREYIHSLTLTRMMSSHSGLCF